MFRILTQNRETLMGASMCSLDGKRIKAIESSGSYSVELGTYATDERAKEVFNGMVQFFEAGRMPRFIVQAKHILSTSEKDSVTRRMQDIQGFLGVMEPAYDVVKISDGRQDPIFEMPTE